MLRFMLNFLFLNERFFLKVGFWFYEYWLIILHFSSHDLRCISWQCWNFKVLFCEVIVLSDLWNRNSNYDEVERQTFLFCEAIHATANVILTVNYEFLYYLVFDLNNFVYWQHNDHSMFLCLSVWGANSIAGLFWWWKILNRILIPN